MKTILGQKHYTTKEAAELLGVTPASVRNYKSYRGLEATILGGRCYFTEQALKDFLKVEAGSQARGSIFCH